MPSSWKSTKSGKHFKIKSNNGPGLKSYDDTNHRHSGTQPSSIMHQPTHHNPRNHIDQLKTEIYNNIVNSLKDKTDQSVQKELDIILPTLETARKQEAAAATEAKTDDEVIYEAKIMLGKEEAEKSLKEQKLKPGYIFYTDTGSSNQGKGSTPEEAFANAQEALDNMSQEFRTNIGTMTGVYNVFKHDHTMPAGYVTHKINR